MRPRQKEACWPKQRGEQLSGRSSIIKEAVAWWHTGDAVWHSAYRFSLRDHAVPDWTRKFYRSEQTRRQFRPCLVLTPAHPQRSYTPPSHTPSLSLFTPQKYITSIKTMGRSFNIVRQPAQPQPQIASPHDEDVTSNPEMSIPSYRKWSEEHAFDPDSAEFFSNAVWEAFVSPSSPVSPISPASLSSASSSERVSSRDLSPPHFRDTREDQPSGVVSGGSGDHVREHNASRQRHHFRMTTGGLAPRRLPDAATRTYRPLMGSHHQDSDYPGITTLDAVMDPSTDSDSDDENKNNPDEPAPFPLPRLRTSSITPIPLPSADLRARGGLSNTRPHEDITPWTRSTHHLAPSEAGTLIQPITPPQALRELFAETEPSFIASTPVHAGAISIPATPSTPAANMNSVGTMISPSPPPSVTPRLYSWTGGDALPSLRVPESPSAGRERESRDRGVLTGSPPGRGLRTVNGVRNARWPVY